MGALGASGFIFRDFIKYILPTITGACLLLPVFVPWRYLKIDQIVFISILVGYIIYPVASCVANFVHDHLPCREISLSKDSPAVKQSRWVKKNWDLKGLRPKIDKDEREYLYLTLSYLEYFQITAFYFLLFSLCNFVNILLSVPRLCSIPNDSIDLFNFFQSITVGTIVGSPVPSLYAGLIGLILSYSLFHASVVEYRALYGIDGAYEFLLKKYHLIYGGLAHSIWGQVLNIENVPIEHKGRLTLELFRNNHSLGTCTTDDDGRFQFHGSLNACINYKCKVVIVTPGFSGESEMSITSKSIPNFSIAAAEVDSSRL
jgi:hypothetical protein